MITMENQTNQFECKMCGKKFNSQQEMKMHTEQVHHEH
ncbi:MAG: C2H2-type zinc finger protein [Candidatus Thorarchaeota archaeon]